MDLLVPITLPSLNDTAHLVRLVHGTTEAGARSILATGINCTLYTTPDAQLAAEYARLRAIREGCTPAIVTLAVPAAMLGAMLLDHSAHVKPLFPGALDMQQVIFRARAWSLLNRCELCGWRLGAQGREEIECATALEQAG